MTSPNGQNPWAKFQGRLNRIAERELAERQHHNQMRARSFTLLVIQVIVSALTWTLIALGYNITLPLAITELLIVTGWMLLIVKELRHRRHCVLRGRR